MPSNNKRNTSCICPVCDANYLMKIKDWNGFNVLTLVHPGSMRNVSNQKVTPSIVMSVGHRTVEEGNILQPPAPVISAVTAHETFGPTDLTSTYYVCTRGYLVSLGIELRPSGLKSDVLTTKLPTALILKGCGSPVVKVSNHGRHVMSSIPVPLKTRRVGQRCTLNLSRAETSSRWCGVVVRRGGASSGVVHVT
ncbi:uncharacterized protein TNCV_4288831 [Trichonephila clavipes]|nr:uncharacterized protein TNCV_4288831 [Trichonephila clavipes]